MDIFTTGTKRQIFIASVNLFAEKSFETVSLKEIADSIGKRQGGIYNHFESKQHILDSIYDSFCVDFYKKRLSIQKIEPVLLHGSIMDMIQLLNFIYKKDMNPLTRQILRIIQQRKYSDERAREIAKTLLVNEGIKYGEEIFNHAIKLGRLAPFDTHSLSVLCNYCRRSTYMRWILEPTTENYDYLLLEEKRLYEMMISRIIDLKKVS